MFLAQSFVDYSWNDIIQWLKINTLSSSDREELIVLLSIAVITLVLWQFKLGKEIIKPFYVLGVFFHEMGHAIALILMGAGFVQLRLNPRGGGMTLGRYNPKTFGRFRMSIVAAAGPVGSSLVGGLLIIASRNPRITNNILIIVGVFSILTALLWIREWLGFGFMVIILWGLVILAIAFRTPPDVQKLMIQILAIQASLKTFLNIRYLFVYMKGYSDVGIIQKKLFLPYWFWGIMINVLCLEIFIQSIRIAFFTDYFR
ncbi:MAG: M50 family metallopeptidase [Cyanobacteria bacterium P01_A01_bin.84]